MKTIYLDMNIYADYMDSSRPSHNELKEKIDNLKKEYTFLYSPAHMEEIARIHRSQDNENQAIDNITKKMMIISELTNMGTRPSAFKLPGESISTTSISGSLCNFSIREVMAVLSSGS